MQGSKRSGSQKNNNRSSNENHYSCIDANELCQKQHMKHDTKIIWQRAKWSLSQISSKTSPSLIIKGRRTDWACSTGSQHADKGGATAKEISWISRCPTSTLLQDTWHALLRISTMPDGLSVPASLSLCFDSLCSWLFWSLCLPWWILWSCDCQVRTTSLTQTWSRTRTQAWESTTCNHSKPN